MRQLLGGGNFFEGARWHEGHWYVSDLYRHHVLMIDPAGRSKVIADVSHQPSGLGWMPDGSMLIVSMLDRRLLRRLPDGRLLQHADLSEFATGPINDMVVDAAGRAYVANFGFDLFGGSSPAPGPVLLVDTDGRCRVAAEGLRFPNGMVIADGGRTLVVAETFGGMLSAFDIAADGSLSARRDWAKVGKMPPWDSTATLVQTDFAPDGCSIDQAGHVWVADAVGGRACRIAEGGSVLQSVRAPDGWGLYSCAIGGNEGSTLLACIAPDFHDLSRKARAEAMLCTFEVNQ